MSRCAGTLPPEEIFLTLLLYYPRLCRNHHKAGSLLPCCSWLPGDGTWCEKGKPASGICHEAEAGRQSSGYRGTAHGIPFSWPFEHSPKNDVDSLPIAGAPLLQRRSDLLQERIFQFRKKTYDARALWEGIFGVTISCT